MDLFGISFGEKCRCWLFLLNKLRDAAECVYVCDFAAALALKCIYRSDTCRAQSRNNMP